MWQNNDWYMSTDCLLYVTCAYTFKIMNNTYFAGSKRHKVDLHYDYLCQCM